MKILIDDARPQRVEHALAVFPLLGVTTNPLCYTIAFLPLADVFAGSADKFVNPLFY